MADKILMTGGAGFIGSHLAEALLESRRVVNVFGWVIDSVVAHFRTSPVT